MALLTIFLLVFCLLGILPVLYVYTSYSVGSLFPRVCCVLCSVKHRRGEVLLAGFVWQPQFAGPNAKFVRVTGEYFCEHRGEESVRGLSAQRGFIPLGRESDQLRVAPADVEPHCLCAPPWWLGSHLQARIPFLREVQRNRSKEDLETWPPVHSKGNTHPQIPVPSKYTCFIPHKRNSKAGWPGRLIMTIS